MMNKQNSSNIKELNCVKVKYEYDNGWIVNKKSQVFLKELQMS